MTHTTPVAVLVVHGIGRQQADFADGITKELTARFARQLRRLPDPPPLPDHQLVVRAAHWSPVLQPAQQAMWSRLTAGHDLDYVKLRRYMIDFAADAIAYQVTPHDRTVYDAIHACLGSALRELADDSRVGPAAPLAVVGHSLGTVIASNFIWDLQQARHQTVTDAATPLARGETVARLFTLGSPLALWSLRYTDPPFGVPVTVPSPDLRTHFPRSRYPDLNGQWLNFYDVDDVIAWPLRPLNAAYARMVTADVPVNAGGLLSSWNPTCHDAYWTDNDVTVPMVDSLVRLWLAVNPAVPRPHTSE